MNLSNTARHWSRQCSRALDLLSPASDLLIRLWLATIFWQAGTTKLASWDATLYLFQYEYDVPLLPPDLAAALATGLELGIPVLLALGLATRFNALVLFFFNIIAVISYPGLDEIGIKDHQHWGLLLLVPLFHGAGRLSLDQLIMGRLRRTRGSAAGGNETDMLAPATERY